MYYVVLGLFVVGLGVLGGLFGLLFVLVYDCLLRGFVVLFWDWVWVCSGLHGFWVDCLCLGGWLFVCVFWLCFTVGWF